MTYRREPRRRSRMGCLAWLVALIWIILLLILAYRLLVRDQLSQIVGGQIGARFGAPTATLAASAASPVGGAALPTLVASLPNGDIHISESQANAYLAANAARIRPIDAATVHFVPGQIQATIQAAGTTSTATMGLAVQNGQIIVVNPQIDGLLGQVVSADQLASSLQNQLNAQLQAQGRRITDVHIAQGELIIT